MTYREVPIGEAQREMIGDRVVIQLPTPILSAEVQRFSPTALAKHYANDPVSETRFQFDVETILTC